LDNKKNLRYKIQIARDKIPEEIRIEKTRQIAANFIKTDEYRKAKAVLIYYPFRSELDTTIILKKAQKDGKKIILPRVLGDRLDLYFVENLKTQLEKGNFGIMEPITNICKSASISDIDLAVIPGVCFDKNFNRIGYGGGFYDRLIPLLHKGIKKISLCFEMQVIDRIPVSCHDVKVDKIITESNTYEPKTLK